MAHYWFISPKYRGNSKLALCTVVLAFIVILLGAYTRLTDAGLSCPDWPHCYGYLTAPHTSSQLQNALQQYPALPVNIKKAWTEMTHRYFAGTEGIFILILAYGFLFSRKAHGIKAKIIGLLLIGLLASQILLGMLTVTEKLKPVIVLGHLLNGLSLLSILWWAYLDLYWRNDTFLQPSKTYFTPWLWLALFIVIAQITLGGWVSTHYAGLACIDFPYCNGQVLPTLHWQQLHQDLITIHMLHRIGALLTASYLLILSFFLLKNSAWRANGIIIVSLVALQICLGILNIIWLRPTGIALIHHAIAILLLLSMITAVVKAHCMTRHLKMPEVTHA